MAFWSQFCHTAQNVAQDSQTTLCVINISSASQLPSLMETDTKISQPLPSKVDFLQGRRFSSLDTSKHCSGVKNLFSLHLGFAGCLLSRSELCSCLSEMLNDCNEKIAGSNRALKEGAPPPPPPALINYRKGSYVWYILCLQFIGGGVGGSSTMHPLPFHRETQRELLQTPSARNSFPQLGINWKVWRRNGFAGP